MDRSYRGARMKHRFACMCGEDEGNWIVYQITTLKGIIECNYCLTRINFTVDTIEFTS